MLYYDGDARPDNEGGGSSYSHQGHNVRPLCVARFLFSQMAPVYNLVALAAEEWQQKRNTLFTIIKSSLTLSKPSQWLSAGL